MNLVIVGGGHASLPLLRHARAHVEAGVSVTLVSDRPELWYSGMVPEWLGGIYTTRDVTVPLAPICEREGVEFVQARAEALDLEGRAVVLEDGRRVDYDVMVVDVGSVNPGRGAAGSAIRAKPLWRIEKLGAFLEVASGGRRKLVVVGGGAAGTECALNITARPGLDGLEVVVVEPGDRLCPRLPDRLGTWAASTLRDRGATIEFGARAESVQDGTVVLEDGRRLEADAVLWATGSVGHPMLRDAGLEVTDRGFARVDPGLRSSDARVFVAGDSATINGLEDLPKIGVHAVKHGPTLRENVSQTLATLARGDDPVRATLAPFRPYPVAPLMLSTGTDQAWWTAGPVALRGRPALRLKHAIDRRWIDEYRDGASYDGRWDALAPRS
ncbi:NAD(P)/FAD-dependent oxidoreductase [Rubrivirga sp.]|uniref:NAD(P)/FAD-dependent oxidoreductase n=1 Tax=Rubrivirga sp. TaxID=1885344 RepID=UPI003C7609C4